MPLTPPSLPYSVESLVQILADLRNPDGGCPWDLEQDFASIAPYTIEEAHEVADAIVRGDMAELRGELGDLLLQVIYHSRMAEEAGHFTFADVIADICAKMVRRHPHVYGDAINPGAEGQPAHWEAIKAAERGKEGQKGALDGVALGLPALLRAYKLQKRASRVGFDWPDASGPRAKIDEELAECALAADDPDALHDEMGDVLFSMVNWARHLGVDPEAALRDANRKFERRFRSVEEMSDKPLNDMHIDELESLWRRAKLADR
ncbi:nucleoside triphosphate pyrophosphohydrolase [Sphingomonas lacunae]|uniref:Nucleoside triphosphate pyrophosphohydrolase n=1 Tax=Sphingomonas lacunae TaxID=2698828 RepID=A0A6M4AXN8_9SPHN|nr:nucleoside triphosphate pyrophosphohydrolase [Sphingomonas lacunae]QJQ33130.1 nucleoside triphosphate pyrophosphohydrolase [Sphingomonas lacunae]